MGGELGRSRGSCGCRVLVLAGEEDGLSWGGVTGGAGTGKAGGDPLAAAAAAAAAESAAAPMSASRWKGEDGERRRVGRSMLDFAVFKGGSRGARWKSSGMTADRRVSDSLAMLPRLVRRNGMVSGGQGGHDHHCLVADWAFTASTHATLGAIAVRGVGVGVGVDVGVGGRKGWIAVVGRSSGTSKARRGDGGGGGDGDAGGEDRKGGRVGTITSWTTPAEGMGWDRTWIVVQVQQRVRRPRSVEDRMDRLDWPHEG